ncbi:MAG: EAL domain-containing protein [Nitrospirota bacterium]
MCAELYDPKKIKVGDLDFATLFEPRIEEGRIFFNRRRAVIMDVAALGALRQQLIDMLGEELAMGALSRFGYAHGCSDAMMLGESFSWETETDWLAAGPSLHTLEGIVHVTPQKIEFDRASGHFHMYGVWLNSYEAEVHLTLRGKSDHPVCWTLTGYASGYASSFFGRELLAIETECAGKGDPHCRWEIRPVAGWGPEAEPYLKTLKAVDVLNQLQQAQLVGARFRDMALSSADWVWETDAAGQYTYCSGEVRSVLGYDPGQLIGKSLFDFMPSDEAARVKRIFDASVVNKKPIVDLEQRVLAQDRREVVLLINGLPVIDRENRTTALRGIAKDITQRKQIEQSLQESRRRAAFLADLLERSSQPFAVGYADGRLELVNAAFSQLTGYGKEELMTIDWARTLTPPEWRAIEQEKLEELTRTGQPVRYEKEYIRKDGSRVPVELFTHLIRDERGQTRHYYSFVTDITERKRAENSLKESEERLRLFIEHAPAALAMFDREMRYLSASRRWMSDYGLDDRDLRGLSHYDVFPEIPERWKAVHRRALAGEVIRSDADRFERADGSVQWLRWEVRPWYHATGDVGGIVIFSEDITERKLAEETSREKEFLLSESQRIANIGSWSYDVVTGHAQWTPETYRIFGVSPDTFALSLESLLSLIHPEDKTAMQEWIRAALSGEGPGDLEFRIIRPDGSIRFLSGRGGMHYDVENRPVRLMGTVQDITERKKAEETIRYQAYHDLLTGLPNRAQLMLALRHETAEAEHHRKLFAVLHLDIDRFRAINESLGHAVGDKVILAVSERLQSLVRKNDTLARVGSDEFIILLASLDRAEDAALITQTIVTAMRRPFRIDERELYATASIGISMYPEDGRDTDMLLKNADIAVSHAKELGRNTYQFFNPALNRRTVERLLLENNLRQTVEHNELVPYYQPQVNIRTGEIIAIEALVRWRHSALGIIGPAEFIPVAEEIGFISFIDEWMLRTACAQTRAWQKAGLPPFRVTVNLSTQQFQKPTLVHMIKDILNETGLEARYLEIEITESTAMRDIDLAVPNLKGLHEIGVALSIDDFGTGYSSLSYLKRFPLYKLKIDQSFIRDVPKDPDDQAIVRAVIAMGHNLQLRVIAEGVETEDQLSFLKANRCDEIQGYLFSEPLPPEKLEEFIESRT